MRIHLLGLSAALIGSLFVPPSLAQQQSKQQQQQIKRDPKAQQKAEAAADKRKELLEEAQPLADRFAEAMLTRKCTDSFVRGYPGSLGQSLVPPETPASTTFSFRVVQDIVLNAYALPDGRIYITTGMLAHVDNEAQLAMVLGHEIGHVIEEHALESLRRQRSGQRRNKIVGAALGGLLGGKKGGGGGAVQGAAAGAAIGTFAAAVVNSVIRSRYSREQDKEADRIGTELALECGFDPEEEARFWDRQHERFGKCSLRTKIEHSLFGSHPRDRVRAENVRARGRLRQAPGTGSHASPRSPGACVVADRIMLDSKPMPAVVIDAIPGISAPVRALVRPDRLCECGIAAFRPRAIFGGAQGQATRLARQGERLAAF